MQRYTAILRLEFLADSEVEAEITAMEAQTLVEGQLDLTEGDEVGVSHIGLETAGNTPVELIATCVATRNALILTKAKPCWDVAKELDKLIDSLERHDYQFVSSDYDYGRFFDIAAKLLADEKED